MDLKTGRLQEQGQGRVVTEICWPLGLALKAAAWGRCLIQSIGAKMWRRLEHPVPTAMVKRSDSRDSGVSRSSNKLYFQEPSNHSRGLDPVDGASRIYPSI